MKKLIILSIVALLFQLGGTACLADYQDMSTQVETVADFWIGGYLSDHQNSLNPGLAAAYDLPAEATRVGSNKAMEYYSPDSSVSGGFLFKSAPLPSRIHLEFDYYNDNEWFGDLRYNFKDYFLIRLLPRRFYHNLDNLTVYDFNPVPNFDPSIVDLAATPPVTGYNSSGNDVDTYDALVDDYGLKIDIDQYRVRLKTPNFPLHVYSEGEIVKRGGTEQLRFLGGSASSNGRLPGAPSGTPDYTRGRVRVTESRDIDQQSQMFNVGTNAHLGLFEVDLSHKNREFKNDAPAPVYDYEVTSGGTVSSEHNVIPNLRDSSNTAKIHTSHTGRLFASGTYSKISKKNKTSGAWAFNTMGYGEVVWLPVAYLSVTGKLRHQKNEAAAPRSVTAFDRDGTLTKYLVTPGVESKIDTGSLGIRYSQVPSTNLNFLYTNKIKNYKDQSAIEWSRPFKTTKNIYQAGFTNWAIPKVRLTGKYVHTDTDNDFYADQSNPTPRSIVNIDPAHVDHGVLGATWVITPKIVAFVNGDVTREDTDENRLFSSSDTRFFAAKAWRENYLASLSYHVSDQLIITPTYTYMAFEQKSDFRLSSSTVDPDFTTRQDAQNFALVFTLIPIKRLTIDTTVDYTITKGNFDFTSTVQQDGLAIFSETNTKEIGVRLDSEYDLGRGWGLGLDLRYDDWNDTSIDNPSDGSFFGGLFKITKQLYY